ncbi:putative pentatricopeptide repeat-containing protein [Tanacetum coccineum]
MAVIWNPSVRKSVGIAIPRPKSGYIVVGFGVCPDTNGPKLVKVFVNGIIYLRAADNDIGVTSNFIISFDMKSEKFGEVCLPKRLLDAPLLVVAKVNESLSFLEYYRDGETYVCGVWMRKDGANKTFSNIYTIKDEGKSLWYRVLGFRNNGEVVMQLDDDNNHEYRIEVYDPSSGHFNGVGINGRRGIAVLGKHGCFLNFKNSHFENRVKSLLKQDDGKHGRSLNYINSHLKNQVAESTMSDSKDTIMIKHPLPTIHISGTKTNTTNIVHTRCQRSDDEQYLELSRANKRG